MLSGGESPYDRKQERNSSGSNLAGKSWKKAWIQKQLLNIKDQIIRICYTGVQYRNTSTLCIMFLANKHLLCPGAWIQEIAQLNNGITMLVPPKALVYINDTKSKQTDTLYRIGKTGGSKIQSSKSLFVKSSISSIF